MAQAKNERAVIIWQFKECLTIAHNVCLKKCFKPEFETLMDTEKVCLSKCFDRNFEYKFNFFGKLSEALNKLTPETAK